MPLQGRSADDLPLAAYSTGVDPETEPALDPPPVVPEHEPRRAPAYAAAPAVGRPATHDLPADPFGQAAPPAQPNAAAPTRPALRDLLRDPRGNVRDPRLVLGGVVAIGLVLLAGSLLGGGGTGSAAALASPSAPAGPVITVAPVGDASVELTGAVTGTFAMTGVTGSGRPSATTMESSWGDALGNALALGGPMSAGTRTTDADLVLSWTVMVKGSPVTFTSKAGECVIGMAVKTASVTGSFTCHKVKSSDGKLVVGASGTYRT